MTDEHLTTELAVRAMHWRLAPGRYLKSGRGWTSRSGFRPLVDVNDAFRVLDAVSNDYTLITVPGMGFTAEVRFKGQIGKASGGRKARVISLAVANAIGISAEARG